MRRQRGQVFGQTKKPTLSVGQRIVLSCNDGKHAYLFNPSAVTDRHVATGSEEFWSEVSGIVNAGYGERVLGDFARLAEQYPGTPWPTILADYHTRYVNTDEVSTAA